MKKISNKPKKYRTRSQIGGSNKSVSEQLEKNNFPRRAFEINSDGYVVWESRQEE